MFRRFYQAPERPTRGRGRNCLRRCGRCPQLEADPFRVRRADHYREPAYRNRGCGGCQRLCCGFGGWRGGGGWAGGIVGRGGLRRGCREAVLEAQAHLKAVCPWRVLPEPECLLVIARTAASRGDPLSLGRPGSGSRRRSLWWDRRRANAFRARGHPRSRRKNPDRGSSLRWDRSRFSASSFSFPGRTDCPRRCRESW